MDNVFNTNPFVSTLVCQLIGLLLIDDLTANEQLALGNWLQLIGQTLITHGTSQALIETRVSGNIININNKVNKNEYHPVVYNIQAMREVLKRTNPNHTKNAIDLLQKDVELIWKELQNLKEKMD